MNKDILVLSNLPSYEGKVERHLNPLASSMGSVTIICSEKHGGIRREASSNIKIIEPPFGGKIVRALFELLYGFYMLYKKDYDVIIGISLIPHGIYTLLLGWVFDKPTHLRIIGADIPNLSRSRYRKITLTIFSFFDSLAVHGQQHKDFLVQSGVDKSKVNILPGSIDIGKYQNAEQVKKKYDFIWVGGMKPHKRPQMFVKSMSAIKKRGYTFNAIMLGDGPVFDEVKEMIIRENLLEEIDLPGWIPVDETPRYYNSAKYFVLTSEREALGYPLIEAMASGCVCIAPQYTDPADGNTSSIIRDSSEGILIKNISSYKIANRLSELILNECASGIGEMANRSAKRFSQENMSDGWEEIICDTISD